MITAKHMAISIPEKTCFFYSIMPSYSYSKNQFDVMHSSFGHYFKFTGLDFWDSWGGIGANDGARTRDNQNHNLGLYQLSYVRRCRRSDYILFRENLARTALFCGFYLKGSPISKA
jgi:hypothetical protein